MSLASRNRVWELSEQTGYLINSGVRQRPTVNSLKGYTKNTNGSATRLHSKYRFTPTIWINMNVDGDLLELQQMGLARGVKHKETQ